MKYLFFASAVFLAGCFSSNYTLTDFDSKEEYYNKFNDFAKDKSIDIFLKNDSSITSANKARILNNTLIFNTTETESKVETFALSEIKNINYSINSFENASITLKNGNQFNASKIHVIKDSLEFKIIADQTSTNSIPIRNIKEVTYKSRSYGLPIGIGLGIGTAIALIMTRVISAYEEHGMPISRREYNYGNAAILSIPLGIVVGTITGLLIGYNFNYHFQ